jgi:hypothetical protein
MTNNRYILTLKRPFIWLKRVRHRCGYGVHSPFAFSFITDVVYEKTPYYCYRTLHEQRRSIRKGTTRRTSERICRLLFRIANFRQPATASMLGGSPLMREYVHAARRSMRFLSAEESAAIDLLLIDADSAAETERLFRQSLPRLNDGSLCIVMGIRYSDEMKRLWRKLQEEEAVGITFDLYDLGVIFFDRKKIKQHYIVNF